MKILTEKQKAVLKFIENYQMRNGHSPTLRVMREHFGVSSDNSILKHLKALEAKGCIKKDDSPRGGIALLSKIKEKLSSSTVQVPVLGSIPAGGPVLSEEYIEKYMDFSPSDVYKPEKSFILRVRGESMKDAGIYDGDLVIACSTKEPRAGDVVVALVDNENTVKRYMKERGRVYLKPENDAYKNIYPENELCVQGVVTGLVRSYY
ncbi:MAG: transcriptional repressor LexA [Nitrospirota bacterium]|nr:transcriptional repressor LexA [Patescibacteria group bacterium]